MAVPSASTKLPSVVQAEEVAAAAASVAVVATTLEVEEVTAEEEVAIVCVSRTCLRSFANIPRRRWRRLWWWT